MPATTEADYWIDAEHGVVWRKVGHFKPGTGYVYMHWPPTQTERVVHRIVWESVHGPIPDGLQINHKNGIKTDNRIDNLELVTPRQNHDHATYVLGVDRSLGKVYVGEAHHNATITDDMARQVWDLWRENPVHGRKAWIADHLGIGRGVVYRILGGRNWTHLNY